MLQIFYPPKGAKGVTSLGDFPAPVGNVISLPANTDWLIVGEVDLQGNRIVCAGKVGISGVGRQIATLQSTGLSGSDALITTAYALIISDLTITSATAPALSINGGGTESYQMTNVNITNTPLVGSISNINTFLAENVILVNSSQLTFSGSVASSIIFSWCRFVNAAATSAIILATDLVVANSVILAYCRFNTSLGGVSIQYVAGASIPIDEFIIDGCSFKGTSATHIAGILASNNICLWSRNKGISNSNNNGEYSMENNAVPTVIPNTTTYVKAAGTTIAGDLQRFTHSNNRLTYIGAMQRTFSIAMSLSMSSGTSNILRVVIRHYNSANVLIKSSIALSSTANGTGRAENIAGFLTTNMSNGDYLEVWVRNSTTSGNITVSELQLIASLA